MTQANALDARNQSPLAYAPEPTWEAWYFFLHTHKRRLRGKIIKKW